MSLSRKKSFINKNMINGFSFGVLLVLLIIQIWIIYDKHNVFLENNKSISHTAVNNVKEAILIALETKKRTLDNFVENNRSHIVKLIEQPDNKAQFDYLFNKLKKQLPDLFTINVYREGFGIITEYNDFVGRICKVDLEDYMAVDFHEKRTHPSTVLYHYDEISSLQVNNQRFLFFASFSLDVVVNILDHSTPEDHNLMIVSDSGDGADGWIEITNNGVRNLKDSRKSPIIKSLDSENILSKLSIPETHWNVIDLQDRKFIDRNLDSYIFPSTILYILVAVIILFMRSVLNNSFSLLSNLNEQLVIRNKEITELNSELEDLSVTDALTALYNRRYFDMQYKNEWNRAFRDNKLISVMIIDVDYFKKYNDTYGHPEGDKCLQQVATILKSCINRSSEFVARFGGEEFIAVVNDNKKACEEISRQIHAALQAADLEHKQSDLGRVTVSIGIASAIPDKNNRRSDAIKKADDALYKAKMQGRNQTVIYDV